MENMVVIGEGGFDLICSSDELSRAQPYQDTATLVQVEHWRRRLNDTVHNMPISMPKLCLALAIETLHMDTESLQRKEIIRYLSAIIGYMCLEWNVSGARKISTSKSPDWNKLFTNWKSGVHVGIVVPMACAKWVKAHKAQAKVVIPVVDGHEELQNVFSRNTQVKKDVPLGELEKEDPRTVFVTSESKGLVLVHATTTNVEARVFHMISTLFYSLSCDYEGGPEYIESLGGWLGEEPLAMKKKVDKLHEPPLRLFKAWARRYEVCDPTFQDPEITHKWMKDLMTEAMLKEDYHISIDDMWEKDSPLFDFKCGEALRNMLLLHRDKPVGSDGAESGIVARICTLISRPSAVAGYTKTMTSTLPASGYKTPVYWKEVDGLEDMEYVACEEELRAIAKQTVDDISKYMDVENPDIMSKVLKDICKVKSAAGDKFKGKVSRAELFGDEGPKGKIVESYQCTNKTGVISMAAHELASKRAVLSCAIPYDLSHPNTFGTRDVPGRQRRLVSNVPISGQAPLMPVAKAMKCRQKDDEQERYTLAISKGHLIEDCLKLFRYSVLAISEFGSDDPSIEGLSPTFCMWAEDFSTMDQHTGACYFKIWAEEFYARAAMDTTETAFTLKYGKNIYELVGDGFMAMCDTAYVSGNGEVADCITRLTSLPSGSTITANVNSDHTVAVQTYLDKKLGIYTIFREVWGDDVWRVVACNVGNVNELLNATIAEVKSCNQLYSRDSCHGLSTNYLQKGVLGNQFYFRGMSLDGERMTSPDMSSSTAFIDKLGLLACRLGSTKALEVFNIAVVASSGCLAAFGKQFTFSADALMAYGGPVSRIPIGVPSTNPKLFLRYFGEKGGLGAVKITCDKIDDMTAGSRALAASEEVTLIVRGNKERINVAESANKSASCLIDHSRVGGRMTADMMKYSYDKWPLRAACKATGTQVRGGTLSRWFLEKEIASMEVVDTTLPKLRFNTGSVAYEVDIAITDIRVAFHGDEIRLMKDDVQVEMLRRMPHPFGSYPMALRRTASLLGMCTHTPKVHNLLSPLDPGKFRSDMTINEVVRVLRSSSGYIEDALLGMGFARDSSDTLAGSRSKDEVTEAYEAFHNYNVLESISTITDEYGATPFIHTLSNERVERLIVISGGMIDVDGRDEIVNTVKSSLIRAYVSILYDIINLYTSLGQTSIPLPTIIAHQVSL
jgi:hypothetical protein